MHALRPLCIITKTIMAPRDEKRSPHLACGDTQRDEGGGFQLTKNNNRETVTEKLFPLRDHGTGSSL